MVGRWAGSLGRDHIAETCLSYPRCSSLGQLLPENMVGIGQPEPSPVLALCTQLQAGGSVSLLLAVTQGRSLSSGEDKWPE